MEIEVGEYVRTKEGKIDKVINDDYYMSLYIENEKGLVEISSIKKHSKDIIDLLEIGDFVKIHNEDICDEDIYILWDTEKEDIKDNCIVKEILTHEQLKKNSFRLEEN